MRSQVLTTTVSHARGTPLRHGFRHASTAWLIDVGALGRRTWPRDLPTALGTALSFRSTDHLGAAENTWYDNVLAFASARGVDLTGHRVLALTTARSLGYAFNPLTVYWCIAPDDAVTCVIAEVHNTYGERHVYLLDPDSSGAASTEKAFYVSPFNDTDGTYRMRVPAPVDGEVDVRITLHRDDLTPFVTSWTGRPPGTARGRISAWARALGTPWAVAALIRIHGIWLWMRRLPIVPRPTHRPQEAA